MHLLVEPSVKLRKEYIRYGKFKLLNKYQKLYSLDENISDWKIQCIIQVAGIYYKLAKNSRIHAKRKTAQNKKRITELKKKPRNGFLIGLDSIVGTVPKSGRYLINI